ncbi:MAG: transposase [Saprospiraceae bacterium]|nr:transposase [Saprospiraceae bacterium]
MPRRIILDQYGLNYLTMTTIGWIDIFTRPVYKEILINSLKYCQQEKGLIIYAYVIMSNHIYLIASVKNGNRQPLGEVIRDFKKFTAQTIWQAIQTGPESRKMWLEHVLKFYGQNFTAYQHYQIWIHGSHPTLLFTDKVIWQKINYIHENPVRQGIVEHPSDYLYSSARNYLQLPMCPLKVTRIDPVLF